MALFPSEQWTKEFMEAVNASDLYRDAAADWEGDVTFVFEAEPDKGVNEDVYGWFDLWHGECRDWTYGTDKEKGESAKFVIRAPYSRWKEVIKGELDPVKGMMQSKIKLKGDMPTIVRYVKASNELVTLASKIPTEFADEQ
ncbi:MAG TPA: SCP2 sterol-binding domain-containing protein [Actinomycetota bacterium]|nr:SCP2 sterol-binding domain-containing protein [Actinomycetota bacterium]